MAAEPVSKGGMRGDIRAKPSGDPVGREERSPQTFEKLAPLVDELRISGAPRDSAPLGHRVGPRRNMTARGTAHRAQIGRVGA